MGTETRDSEVTYTLDLSEISHIFHLNCGGGGGVRLTDGEATFGGMRVEMVRRKARDMVNRLIKLMIEWRRLCRENPGVR